MFTLISNAHCILCLNIVSVFLPTGFTTCATCDLKFIILSEISKSYILHKQ